MKAYGIELEFKETALVVGVIVAAVIVAGYAAKGAVTEAAGALNPTNPDNVLAGAVNSTGAAVSGQTDWTLGGWLYDTTHEVNPITGKPVFDIFGAILDGIILDY